MRPRCRKLAAATAASAQPNRGPAMRHESSALRASAGVVPAPITTQQRSGWGSRAGCSPPAPRPATRPWISARFMPQTISACWVANRWNGQLRSRTVPSSSCHGSKPCSRSASSAAAAHPPSREQRPPGGACRDRRRTAEQRRAVRPCWHRRHRIPRPRRAGVPPAHTPGRHGHRELASRTDVPLAGPGAQGLPGPRPPI